MSKPIYLDETSVDEMLENLRKQLLSQKTYGEFKFDKKFLIKETEKAHILFTPKAWCKMQALIQEYTTEVQWRGLVEREDNNFVITDILVPPHTVAAATVTSDDIKFQEWLDELDDDTFNSLRFHGHSHVNMAVSPSGVDMEYRHNSMATMPRDGDNRFFIFLIFNKRGEWSGEIYDVENNVLYEKNDITVEVMFDDGTVLSDFVADAKKVAVVAPVPAYSAPKKYSKKGEKKAEEEPYDPYKDFYRQSSYRDGAYYGSGYGWGGSGYSGSGYSGWGDED